MSEKESPAAPAATARPAPAPVSPPAPAPARPAELPTIRDHAERLSLEPWKVRALIARLHGQHDEEGRRVFERGVDLTTRLDEEAFDQALEQTLHGRI